MTNPVTGNETTSSVWWPLGAGCTLIIFLLIILMALPGCGIPMMGAGQAGIGYSSTTRVFLFHEVDGDKDGKKSEARLEIDQPILDAILSKRGNSDPSGPE